MIVIGIGVQITASESQFGDLAVQHLGSVLSQENHGFNHDFSVGRRILLLDMCPGHPQPTNRLFERLKGTKRDQKGSVSVIRDTVAIVP